MNDLLDGVFTKLHITVLILLQIEHDSDIQKNKPANDQVHIDISQQEASMNLSQEECLPASTASLPMCQVGSIASVSHLARPEMSSSTAITTTVSHSKTVTIPAPVPNQTISVKKMWEERQKISLSRERRATRILGIVMGVFVACW